MAAFGGNLCNYSKLKRECCRYLDVPIRKFSWWELVPFFSSLMRYGGMWRVFCSYSKPKPQQRALLPVVFFQK